MKYFKCITLSMLLGLSFAAFGGPVNINTADVEELAQTITGVGLKKAQAIVAFREQRGPFKSVDELTQVDGIGIRLIEKNRENLSIKDQ